MSDLISFALTERLRGLRQLSRNGGPGTDDQRIDGLLDLIEYAKPASVIEIGSDYGVSTEVWLLQCSRVVAVDPWPDEAVYLRFIERCGGYKGLEIVRGYSPQVLYAMPQRQFDLCYIDGAHNAVQVALDIVHGLPLVKRGGFIAGHDYHTFFGVRVSVNSLLGQPEHIFSDGSWVVRK